MAGELVGSVGLRSLLEGQRSLRKRRLEEYRRVESEHFGATDPAELPTMQKLALMTLRLGIRGEEAWLEWAKELEVALRGPEG
jgi:hypothetical protein